jgi:hypothetical protein
MLYDSLRGFCPTNAGAFAEGYFLAIMIADKGIDMGERCP